MAAKQGKGNPFPMSPSKMGGKAVSDYAKTIGPSKSGLKKTKVGGPKPVSK